MTIQQKNLKKKLFLKVFIFIVIIAALLFAAFSLYIRSSQKLPSAARDFIAPKSGSTSWEQVFKKPAPVKMIRLITGTVKVKRSDMLNLKHPGAAGLADEELRLNVFSYLIQHAKYGNFLVDAGLGASIQKNPYGNVKGVFGKMLLYSQETGMDIVSVLKKKKITLKGVFLTHLHYDHTSGLDDLPSDMNCYFGKNERYMNFKFLYENDCLKGRENIYQLDFSKAQIMEPLGQSLDIFGDGSMWAISTPGHTAGHISYLINAKDNPVLITGDAITMKYQLESGVGPGAFSSNIDAAQASFDAIIRFHEKYPQVNLALGHEI
jgi:N-acyl homoserine lactone hydrolase